MAFTSGLKKIAAPKFTHGGYAMKLFRESQAMKKSPITPAAVKPKVPPVAVGAAAATQKAVSDTLTPSVKATLKTVTPRPFKYGEM